MKKTPRARVSALVEKDGKYLLVKEFIKSRNGVYWLTPGGGVEYGERVEDALKREVKEETGIEIESGDLFSVKDLIVPNKVHSICMYFLAKAIGGSLKREDQSYDVGFYTIEEMKNMKITPFTRELFSQLENKNEKI